MLTITAAALHTYFQVDAPNQDIDYKQFKEQARDLGSRLKKPTKEQFELLQQIQEQHVRCIVSGSEMSEAGIGGDDIAGWFNLMIDLVNSDEDWKFLSWYGPNSELLVVAYHDDEVEITK